MIVLNALLGMNAQIRINRLLDAEVVTTLMLELQHAQHVLLEKLAQMELNLK